MSQLTNARYNSTLWPLSCLIQTLADLEKIKKKRKKKHLFLKVIKFIPEFFNQVDGPEKPLVQNVSHHLRGVPHTLED